MLTRRSMLANLLAVPLAALIQQRRSRMALCDFGAGTVATLHGRQTVITERQAAGFRSLVAGVAGTEDAAGPNPAVRKDVRVRSPPLAP